MSTKLAAVEGIVGTEATFVIIDELDGDGNARPPRILSLDLLSPHYHPCYVRVGVRIDGEERNDVAYYNQDDLSYMTERKTSHLATSIEPYWRYQPSRQQRRAEERFRRRS